ncbi:MAG: ATP synthase F1 subunit delta [Eubacterium sp.]|nr:ATP synthase F1 subunit delta [Eubacterium sp.]
MAKVISKVYGDALFSLALENDKLDTIWEEVRMTRQILSENPTFVKTICHPEISKQDQIKLLDDAFKGKVSDEVMGFFHVLADKKRLKELDAVLEYFDRSAKEYKKIGVVYVTVPMELTKAQQDKIRERILEVSSYETLEMHVETDASLLGGMVIRIGDEILDNSIRSKMEHMARKINQIKLSS